MKKFLAACVACLMVGAVAAQTLPPPSIAARSWLLLDATSNQILASQDPDQRIEPASLTKIMTAYLAFSAVRDKKLDLSQTINVSVNAWKVDGDSSKMFIEPNTAVRVMIFCTASLCSRVMTRPSHWPRPLPVVCLHLLT